MALLTLFSSPKVGRCTQGRYVPLFWTTNTELADKKNTS